MDLELPAKPLTSIYNPCLLLCCKVIILQLFADCGLAQSPPTPSNWPVSISDRNPKDQILQLTLENALNGHANRPELAPGERMPPATYPVPKMQIQKKGSLGGLQTLSGNSLSCHDTTQRMLITESTSNIGPDYIAKTRDGNIWFRVSGKVPVVQVFRASRRIYIDDRRIKHSGTNEWKRGIGNMEFGWQWQYDLE